MSLLRITSLIIYLISSRPWIHGFINIRAITSHFGKKNHTGFEKIIITNEHFKWRKPLTAIKKKRKQENKHMSLKFASMLCLGSCQVSQTTFDILCFWLSDIRISLKGYSEISLKGYIEGERELRDQQMSHPGYSCIISGWWSKQHWKQFN